MSYEEDLKHLRTTLEKLEKLHSDAVVNGDHMDEMLYKENVENVKHQIHIHEQAAKADEYEAKAKAWDDLNKALLGKRDGFKSLLFMDEDRHDAPIIASEIKNFDGILNLMNDKLSEYESGEQDV